MLIALSISETVFGVFLVVTIGASEVIITLSSILIPIPLNLFFGLLGLIKDWKKEDKLFWNGRIIGNVHPRLNGDVDTIL